VKSYPKKIPGMVAHVCNPNYLGGRGRRMVSETSTGKKVRHYLKKKTKKAKGLGAWLKR
jgi:hypothetical protein